LAEVSNAHMIEQLAQDFRIGSRILWKAPALSATAVILIALVIGGNTTVYAVLYAFISKPAPGVQGEGLVTLVPARNPQDFAHSYPDYRDYAAQSTTLYPLIASAPERVALSADSGTYAYYGGSVSQNYFEGLGVILAKGRSFNEIESRPGATGLVAVISHRVWRDHFQESPDVLGRLIRVNGHSAEIIGVAPVRFRGAHLGNPEDVWVPLLSFARFMGRERLLSDRSSASLALVGRLLPNVTLSRARAEFATISARLQNTYRDSANERGAVPVRYTGGAFTGVSDGSNVVLAVLSVVTFITLLIVSANVANLMLGRGLTRQHENAIRQSLGASRLRIVRIMLAEGFTISLTAWAAACVFAYWMSKAIVGLFPDSSPGSRPNDLQIDLSLDWQVLSYAAILAVMSAVMFTIAPAVRAWRLDLVSDLKAAGHGLAQRRSRLSSLLVVVQLAFSVVLLTACGLAYRSMSLLNAADPGFTRNNVLLLGVNPTLGTPAGKDALLIEQLRERLGVVPGVESVSYGRLPWQRDTVALNNSPISVTVHSNYVGPDYLRVLGLRPIIGREFTLEDRGGSRGAILSQSLAEMLWPAQSPLGQTLLFGEARIPVEVIGVAPNAWYSGMGREPRPLSVFLAEQQNPARLSGDYARQEAGETSFHIRFAGDLASVSSAVVAAVQEVDPRIPVVFTRTLDTQSGSAVQAMQLILNLFMLFTGGSLLIAALGQYAVVSFNFKRRIREFGVRAAVGASSRQIARHVLKEGLLLTAMGLAAGFVLSIGVSTVLAGALYGVKPSDAITHLVVFTLLSLTSLIACYLPARRAARIDPVIALRHE
jgi:predicted permease